MRIPKYTISSFVKAMSWIAMACEDGDFVAEVLQANGGIDHEPLGPTDS